MFETICIAGKNAIAVDALRHLAENFRDYELIAVPNARDDGEDGWQPSLRRAADDLGIVVRTLEEVQPNCDMLFLSLECDRILKTGKFTSPHLYNIHFSMLPAYKGVFTSAHPLLNGETASGVTLHRIDDGIDTGDIVAQRAFDIAPADTARDLYGKYLRHALALFREELPKLLSGSPPSRPQQAENASYYSLKSIDYATLAVDFRKTAFEVRNQFRAYSFREYQLIEFGGWPIAASVITDQKSHAKPGSVLEETDRDFLVATVDYAVRLTKDYYARLWKACEQGDPDGVRCALAFVPDIDLRDSMGWNALIRAVYHGHARVAELLIADGARCDATNYKGTSLAMYALSRWEASGDDRTMRLVLDAGVDTSHRDRFGKTVLDWAREKGLGVALGKMLGAAR